MKNKTSYGEKFIDITIYIIVGIIAIVSLYPMVYVVMASFSEPVQLMQHKGLLFRPLGISLVGYKAVFENPNVWSGYANTIFYVVVGTIISVTMTIIGAFVLSRKNLMFKKLLTIMAIFTMYFKGGIIPTFLLVHKIGLYNTRFALILPVAIITWNLIVMKTSFQSIHPSLEESAKIDGANEFKVLYRIIIPVSMATIAVITLFYAVTYWNSWFTAAIYLQNRSLYPLQLLLREILISSSSGGNIADIVSAEGGAEFLDELMKYCTIVVTTLPVLLIYPFAQKYFVKGIMIGSIKE